MQRMAYHQGFALYLPFTVILSLGEESSNIPPKADSSLCDFYHQKRRNPHSRRAYAFCFLYNIYI